MEPDGNVVPITLVDPTGTGTFEASFVPAVRGEHSFIVTADGTTFQRSAMSSFSAGGGIAIAGGYSERTVDSDGDGFFNLLDIDGSLTVQLAGEFSLVGELVASGGVSVGAASTVVDATSGAGSYPFTLEWSNEHLIAAGVDGPWHLQNLQVFDLGTHSSLEFEVAYAFGPTAVSSLTQFDPLPAPLPERLSPAFGPFEGGTRVWVSGEGVGVDPGVQVKIGDLWAPSVQVVSRDLIAVVIPATGPLAQHLGGGGSVAARPNTVGSLLQVDVTVIGTNGSGVLTGGWTWRSD